MKYMDKMDYKKYQPKWDCASKCEMMDDDYDDDDDYDCGCMDYKPYKPMKMCSMPNMPYMQTDSCEMPMSKCKTEKTCVKTYKCTYKLYKVCTYKLYKVCPHCGKEYEYYKYRMCPRCR
jgi:hypothetical protein